MTHFPSSGRVRHFSAPNLHGCLVKVAVARKKTTENFADSKIMPTFATRNRKWTFSSAGLEYLSDRQRVDGSNPPTSTFFISRGCFPEWPNGADCKSAVFRLRWFESISTHSRGDFSSEKSPLEFCTLSLSIGKLVFFPIEPLFTCEHSYSNSYIRYSRYKYNFFAPFIPA